MDSEVTAAAIGASVGLIAAALSWWASKRSIANQRQLGQDQLEATRKNLELQLETQKAQLQKEHAHELARVLQESRYEYDLELLKRRLDEYKKLFEALEPLALDGRPPPDSEQVRALVAKLTKWYYESGGLLLSDQARDVLFELRRELRGLPPHVDETAQLKEAFPARAAASRLRTKLTEDAFSRHRAFDASPLNAD